MNKQSILVVDDNPDNLVLIQILLEGEGHQVRLAENAAQTLEILKAYTPALILMDVQLPGMDGLELTRLLRKEPKWRSVPIVALTAYAMKQDRDKAFEAGCNGYITKPIDTRVFPSLVGRYLNPSHQSDAALTSSPDQ